MIDTHKAYYSTLSHHGFGQGLHGIQVEGFHDEDGAEMTQNFTILSGSTFYPPYQKITPLGHKFKKMRSKKPFIFCISDKGIFM